MDYNRIDDIRKSVNEYNEFGPLVRQYMNYTHGEMEIVLDSHDALLVALRELKKVICEYKETHDNAFWPSEEIYKADEALSRAEGK